jgi:amino acid transporter
VFSRVECEAGLKKKTVENARPLQRILGLGFGVAIAFGTMVGVGILRLPGTVAAVLGDRTLIMVFWALGGLYSLMGAVAVAELAAMIPVTGGFRVYAQRAFGEGIGFAVGWCDWLNNAVSLAYGSITAVAFLGVLWPAATVSPRIAALRFSPRSPAFTGWAVVWNRLKRWGRTRFRSKLPQGNARRSVCECLCRSSSRMRERSRARIAC